MADQIADIIDEHSAENDAPVPVEEQLGCALWKCHRNAVQGPGDGTVTWWTLQPIERQWWLDTADNFRDALIAHPGLLDGPSWEHDDGTPCPNTYGTFRCGEHGLDTRVIPPGSGDTNG